MKAKRESKYIRCPRCAGTGREPSTFRNGDHWVTLPTTCAGCRGWGRIEAKYWRKMVAAQREAQAARGTR